MKDRLKVALVCLLFAVPFGGVGAFASWMIGTMVRDASRATEWVKVRAEVDAPSSYRYTFEGREYHGTRLGLEPLGGTDNIDGWHGGMAELFANAMAEKKPITVYVNPDNPAEAVVDRQIRWKLVMFMSVFALAFGGVGVGALVFAARSLIGPSSAPVRTTQAAGIGTLWIFAFFWNVISFPIAILVVPDALADGEWAALLVLLFPLIGLLVLWGAIAGTIKAIRAKFAGRPAPALGEGEIRKPANDGFARGMIGDKAGVIDSADTGLPAADDAASAEIERLSGTRLNARQREALAKLSPEQREKVTKLAGVLGKITQE